MKIFNTKPRFSYFAMAPYQTESSSGQLHKGYETKSEMRYMVHGRCRVCAGDEGGEAPLFAFGDDASNSSGVRK